MLELSREVRYWVTQVVLPVTLVAIAVVPEVRYAIAERVNVWRRTFQK